MLVLVLISIILSQTNHNKPPLITPLHTLPMPTRATTTSTSTLTTSKLRTGASPPSYSALVSLSGPEDLVT